MMAQNKEILPVWACSLSSFEHIVKFFHRLLFEKKQQQKNDEYKR